VEADMPFYLTQAKLSKEAVQAMIARPQDRSGPVGKMLQAVGGKLHHYFFAFGEYDIVLLYEAPDSASAAAPLLAAAGAGTISGSKTTVLMSMDEAMASMTKAGKASGAYQPPT
jgi:uncharacterized protein with GYD domain